MMKNRKISIIIIIMHILLNINNKKKLQLNHVFFAASATYSHEHDAACPHELNPHMI